MVDNYFDKQSRKGRLVNVPMGHTGFESSGKLTDSGKVFKNNLLDTDYTSQQQVVKKTKGVY